MSHRPTRLNRPPGAAGPVVLVVDDDDAMREALEGLCRSVGLNVRLFDSAASFMRGPLPDAPSCLVLDIRLPGVSGLDFQADLAAAGILMPIIFMTGHGDIPMSVQAMKAGAVDFLTKPFRQHDMIQAVNRALAVDSLRRERLTAMKALRELYQSLTSRERDVMAQVATGARNKRIAVSLGISEVTVKVHRVHVMRKMKANSLADLIRMADLLGVSGGQ